MPILEWPKYLEARWIVRGDTKASYDNSRLAGMLAEQFSYVVCAAYGYGYASAQLV
jgi:hypothetical protein